MTRSAKQMLMALILGCSAIALSTAQPSTARGQFSDLLGSSGPRISTSARFVADESARTGVLHITAEVGEGWHVYALSQPKAVGAPQAINIVVDESADYTVNSDFVADVAAEIKILDVLKVEVHELHGKVTWSARVRFADEVDIQQLQITGKLAGQICEDDGVCVILNNDEGSFAASYDAPATSADWAKFEVPPTQSLGQTAAGQGTAAEIGIGQLAKYVGFAMMAGFILNFMPCVLPVIGLKIMSFVNQAGENRARVFLLNLTFSLGLLSVFLVLATASSFLGMGWGDYLTKSMLGSVIVTSLVFAFGLSMLGVWEIPIPGMSGSSGAGKLAQEEGLSGAFFLGVFTTILATPCTGPFLGSALGFTASQPAWVTYLIFSSIGLGMAIPYLLIGLNPSWISWLPKPGMWMNTFKEVMGFVLMATVVFLLKPFGEESRADYLIPMLSLLLAVGVGCWWIGRTSIAAEFPIKAKAWGIGLAIVVTGAAVGFGLLGPSKYELDYQRFTQARLGELRAASRVVLVDFTGPN